MLQAIATDVPNRIVDKDVNATFNSLKKDASTWFAFSVQMQDTYKTLANTVAYLFDFARVNPISTSIIFGVFGTCIIVLFLLPILSGLFKASLHDYCALLFMFVIIFICIWLKSFIL